MHSVYFITDFSYNPTAVNPLKIFEFGDAFTSDYPDKKLGKAKLSPHDYFRRDLKKQYPNALLVQVFPSGLNIFDLESDTSILTYDTQNLFSKSVDKMGSSYSSIIHLIREIIHHAEKRSPQSRLLVISVGHPIIYEDMPDDIKEHPNLKLVNYYAPSLHQAFFNKKRLHDFAHGNPIYPSTLYLSLHGKTNKQTKSEINKFITATKSDYYVIKPARGTRAEHVHIVSRNNLEKTIKGIRGKDIFPEAFDRFFSYGILIQTCHASKLISFKGKSFIPKARAIIRADFNEDNTGEFPSLDFIVGYWQVARKPFNGQVNDDTVIDNAEVNEGILEISPTDWQEIKRQFQNHLPIILKNMANTSQHVRLFGNTQSQLYGNNNHPFETVINNFLQQQVLTLHGPNFFEKIFYYWNTYIENSEHQELVKKFVVDITGVNQVFKKNIRYNDKPINNFVSDAVVVLESRNTNMLNQQPPSILCKFKKEIKLLFIPLAVMIALDFGFTHQVFLEPFLVTLLTVLLAYLVMQLASDINRSSSSTSYFFHKVTENRSTIAKNEMLLVEKKDERLDLAQSL